MTSITGLNGEKREYTYDAFGQVTSAVETYADGTTLTYAYTYDAGGNLLTEVITDADGNAVTHTYEYAQDWKDQLIRYDGQEITYAENQVGCPASYRGMTLTWDELQGKLTGICRDGKELARYAYASDGTRYEKTAGGHTTAYHYNNGLLLSQTTDTEKLNFYYDSEGKILQLGYQKKTETGWDTERTYFFARNAFGDIIAVYRNSDSKLMGTYEYDLWGRQVSMKEAAAGIDTDNILELNPYRYRGYYYDAESGLYYLNARYYDPEARRFVNADDLGVLEVDQDHILQYNLFAYCLNNPVNRFDDNGNFSLPNWAKVAIGAVALTGAIALTVATGGGAAPVLIGVAVSTIGGAADGFMTGGLCALGGSVIGGAARTIKNARSGITIGKVGQFEKVAEIAKTRHYSGLKEFNLIEKAFGTKAAETVGWWQNKCVVKGGMALKGAIYDCGGALTGAYAKEVALTKGYQYLYNVWLM